MKEKWKKLLICLAVPLSVGGLSAFLTRDGMKTFQTLKKPPLSPPAWVFPLVWTILFLLMGTASFLVLESGKSRRAVRRALTVYGAQLAANFFWPLLFFGLGGLRRIPEFRSVASQLTENFISLTSCHLVFNTI